MRNLITIFLIVFVLSTQSVSAKADYETLYNEAEVPKIKLMHDLDPYQAEDYLTYAYAPFALFRTASYLYFKEITIPPGYYLLAARTIKGKDYVFFKEAGKVKYIIPVMETDVVLEDFYKRMMPVPEKTKWQKFKQGVGNAFSKIGRDSKRQPPPNSYIEAQRLDANFYQVIYYYGNKKYTMYFRTSSF